MFLVRTASAIDWDSLRINGYSSFEIERMLSHEGPGDRNLSFDADLIDLVFNFQPTEKTRVSADVTWEHGAATEDNRGNVALEYGFVEHSLFDWLKFRAGKFLIPFGIYNEIHTSKPSFLSVKEASSTNKTERITSNGFRFFPRWGAGVGLKGDFQLFSKDSDYDLMFSNGETETDNPFEKDPDLKKALTARVRIHLNNWLEVGNSIYWDTSLDPTIGRVRSIGLLAKASFGRWSILSEFVRGKRESGTPGFRAHEVSITQHQFGSFLQFAYSVRKWSLTPYLRYEYLEPNFSVKDDAGWVYIVGLNWEIDDAIILKLEDQIVHGQSAAEGIPGNGYNEIKLAMAVGF